MESAVSLAAAVPSATKIVAKNTVRLDTILSDNTPGQNKTRPDLFWADTEWPSPVLVLFFHSGLAVRLLKGSFGRAMAGTDAPRRRLEFHEQPESLE